LRDRIDNTGRVIENWMARFGTPARNELAAAASKNS